MILKLAEACDIADVLKLHAKYQIDQIREEDKADGFVTTAFSAQQLTALIEQEQGLFIARDEQQVYGYVMAASWQFWSAWPMFQFMITQLPQHPFAGIEVTQNNSYQYGPVCIDKSVRGSGLLQQLFAFALKAMSQRFEVLITFINHKNPRSYAAHTRKLGLSVVNDFSFNGNQYYWLACSTHRDIKEIVNEN